MSYILDALRRADAEREREKGAVPGLHARPLTAGTPEPAAAPVRQQGPWLALGVTLGLLAALGWWVIGPAGPGGQTPAPVATVAQAPIVQVVPVPVPMPLPAAPPALATSPVPGAAPVYAPGSPSGAAPAAGPGMARSPGAPPNASPAAPMPAPPGSFPPATARQAPAVAAAARASAAADGAARFGAAAPTAPGTASQGGPVVRGEGSASVDPGLPVASRTDPPLPAPPPPVVQRPVVPLAQLSPDLRREMPPMTMGGSVYSESPASRFVIINGQVVREGEGAAAGVTVERIGAKAAVLRWRELRIEVPL